MKPGIPLSQMLAEVKRQSEAKVDYLVATPRLRLEPFGSGVYLHLYNESGSEPIEPLSISSIAHRQIGTHLKVPAAYYDRMLKDAPELLAQNLNCWFTKEPAQRCCARWTAPPVLI